MDEHTTDSTGGAFIPSVLDCPLPEGIDHAGARIEFVYEANDPGAIDRMTLAASQAHATNAWQQNTRPGILTAVGAGGVMARFMAGPGRLPRWVPSLHATSFPTGTGTWPVAPRRARQRHCPASSRQEIG